MYFSSFPAFKSHVCPSGNVSNTARSHLEKPPLMRTAADLKAITNIINKLKSFERYPQTVRDQLARVVYYECFEDGRVIVRQGKFAFINENKNVCCLTKKYVYKNKFFKLYKYNNVQIVCNSTIKCTCIFLVFTLNMLRHMCFN